MGEPSKARKSEKFMWGIHKEKGAAYFRPYPPTNKNALFLACMAWFTGERLILVESHVLHLR
jgi:hypothetical protein